MEFKCCPPAHVHVIAGSKNRDQDKNLICHAALNQTSRPLCSHTHLHILRFHSLCLQLEQLLPSTAQALPVCRLC